MNTNKLILEQQIDSQLKIAQSIVDGLAANCNSFEQREIALAKLIDTRNIIQILKNKIALMD